MLTCAYRFARRDDANAELKAAQEKGDQEAIEKFSKRTVKVTREHVEDVKKLLTLMGVPYIEVRHYPSVASLRLHASDVLF
jgi:flap endonuclease-1